MTAEDLIREELDRLKEHRQGLIVEVTHIESKINMLTDLLDRAEQEVAKQVPANLDQLAANLDRVSEPDDSDTPAIPDTTLPLPEYLTELIKANPGGYNKKGLLADARSHLTLKKSNNAGKAFGGVVGGLLRWGKIKLKDGVYYPG